ncbi:hypothetical protein C1894_15180 [Pseudomonas sp. FW305-3-2-15-E-TSA2]|nr:hypothetical protein C1895_04995 [Pseudomonas sp. FW305-3-2-15-E-TSA4]POA41446.1 hypothetical protein C1894_15180 [Pseudomonas sp. FW305-3-2-15-E-TSA2]
MGASLLAMALYQATSMLNVPASSRGSPLPQGSVVYTRFVHDRNYCGSGLARESVGPVTTSLEAFH